MWAACDHGRYPEFDSVFPFPCLTASTDAANDGGTDVLLSLLQRLLDNAKARYDLRTSSIYLHARRAVFVWLRDRESGTC